MGDGSANARCVYASDWTLLWRGQQQQQLLLLQIYHKVSGRGGSRRQCTVFASPGIVEGRDERHHGSHRVGRRVAGVHGARYVGFGTTFIETKTGTQALADRQTNIPIVTTSSSRSSCRHGWRRQPPHRRAARTLNHHHHHETNGATIGNSHCTKQRELQPEQ